MGWAKRLTKMQHSLWMVRTPGGELSTGCELGDWIRAPLPKLPGMTGFEEHADTGRRIASRQDLIAAGVTDAELRRLAWGGRRPMRAVYVERQGELDEDERLRAASIWAGRGTILTGAAALRLHVLTVRRLPPVTRFLVPMSRRSRSSALGFATLRTRRLPPCLIKRGVAVARVERSLADAARWNELSPRDLKGLAISVLQRGLTTPDRLARELEEGGIDGTAAVRDGVLAFRKGAWSIPEDIVANAVAEDPRFPVMLLNVPLETLDGRYIGRPDGYFEDAGVVVQVHSKEFHDGEDEAGRDRWAGTVERDTVYTSHQLTVVPVAPETIEWRLSEFLTTLAEIVESRRGQAPDGVRIRQA